MLNMEKIQLAIQKADLKVKEMSESEKERLTKTCDLEPREYVAFQELKSIAFTNQKIDLETAQFIYARLGNWSNTDLATKVILVQIYAMFLGVKYK